MSAWHNLKTVNCQICCGIVPTLDYAAARIIFSVLLGSLPSLPFGEPLVWRYSVAVCSGCAKRQPPSLRLPKCVGTLKKHHSQMHHYPVWPSFATTIRRMCLTHRLLKSLAIVFMVLSRFCCTMERPECFRGMSAPVWLLVHLLYACLLLPRVRTSSMHVVLGSAHPSPPRRRCPGAEGPRTLKREEPCAQRY
jgi:hypothetical protein